jgi:hypothetical protein
LPESIKVSAVRDVNAHPDFSGTVPASLFNWWLEFDLTEPMPFDQSLCRPPICCCCELHCISGCVQLNEDNMNYL